MGIHGEKLGVAIFDPLGADPHGPLIVLAGDADLSAAADLEEMVVGAVANGERP